MIKVKGEEMRPYGVGSKRAGQEHETLIQRSVTKTTVGSLILSQVKFIALIQN